MNLLLMAEFHAQTSSLNLYTKIPEDSWDIFLKRTTYIMKYSMILKTSALWNGFVWQVCCRLKQWGFIFIRQSGLILTNIGENKTRPFTILASYSFLSVSFHMPLGLSLCISGLENNTCSLLAVQIGAVISQNENFRTEVGFQEFLAYYYQYFVHMPLLAALMKWDFPVMD